MKINNWTTRKLGELLQNHESGVWGSEAEDKETGFPILRSVNFTNEGEINWKDLACRDIPNDTVSKLQIKEGDILLEKSGGSPDQPVGRVLYFKNSFIGKPVLFGNFIERLKVQEKHIISRFLFFYLYWVHLIGCTRRLQMHTTGIRNLQLERYLNLKVSIPPLSIQQKIVERLDAIKKAQELNDKQIELAEELFQSLLHRELTPKSKNWEIRKLGDISQIESGGTPSTKKSEYWNGKILWLTPKELSNFQNIEIYETERKITEFGLNKSSAKLLPTGTVLLTSRAPIGYIAIAGRAMATNQGFKNFICNKNLLNNKFLFYFLKYRTKNIQSLGRGATFGEVSKTIVSNIKIPLPPLETQQKIVKKLSAVQDYKNKPLEQKEKHQELFESVLNKSFKENYV